MLYVARYVLVVSLSVLVLSGCTILDLNANFNPVVAKPIVVAKPSELSKAAVAKVPAIRKIQETVANQTIAQYVKLTSEEKQCMQKYYVGYEYALCLYNNGDINSAINYLQSFNPNNQLAAELLQKINQPLIYIVNKANQDTSQWLNRKTEMGAFILQKPVVIERKPVTVSLIKKEFETTATFKQRAALVKKEIAQKEALIKKHYQQKLATYNQLLNTYNTNLEQEKQRRELRSLDIYFDFIDDNIADVLGEPYFSDPIYDADKQQMFSNLLSKKSNFRQPVAINVALENARAFKADIAKVLPVLEFDATRESLTIVNIDSELNGKVYKTQLLDSNQHAVSLRKTISIDASNR